MAKLRTLQFLTLVMLSTSNAVFAQTTEQQAREHFAAGESLAADAQYDDAYAEFAAGYALSQRPLFLFNMAESARRGGRIDAARDDYERYLAADANGRMAEVARARLRELGPRPVVVAPVAQPTPVVAPVVVPDLSPAAAAQASIAVVDNDEVERAAAARRRRIIIGSVVGAVVAVAIAVVVIVLAAQPSEQDCMMGTSSQCVGLGE